MKDKEPEKSQSKISINQEIVLNVTLIKNLLKDSLGAVLKHDNLSQEQFSVLQILRDFAGRPANMYEIQQRMAEKNSNTTRLIDKLLLKKLVIRRVCDENRRKIEIYITEKGLSVLKDTEYKITACEMKFADNMSLREIENLNDLLKKYKNLNN